jgi:hypothetical protein
MTTTETTHQAGDEIDLGGGIEIILASRKGNNGIRWTWYAPDLDVTGMAYKATPEQAIEDARRKLAPNSRCQCGAVAEMNASTGPACTNCYDRLAD